MVVKNMETTPITCEPGVTRRILTYTDEMMMCEMSFEKGAKGKAHSHEHLQMTYIVDGKFEFMVDDEIKVVEKGDSVCMSSKAVHGVTCLEKGRIVDIFNPMRKDFLL